MPGLNYQLMDFMTELRGVRSRDQAGQVFVAFAQRSGANVVHTFFGTAPDMQSVSTLPEAYTREEGRRSLVEKSPLVEAVRAGVPRVIWGADFAQDEVNRSKLGRAQVLGRFHNFRQRSSVTFSMPDADKIYSGAGVGIGYEDSGTQFLKRMKESGGALAVASFAAYSQMLLLHKPVVEKSPLSPRQAEILQLLASGYRLSAISDRLNISDSAVNLYLSKLRAKMGVRTKEQALAIAISKGWVTP